MRNRIDLSGYWNGRLELVKDIDVAAPELIEQPFYVPMNWNKQIEYARWPGPSTELANVVQPVQNQNFRQVHRKFNEGVITYTRKLEIPSAGNNRWWLVFEGSNYLTEVRVNKRRIGVHEGGHLAFEFDITRALVSGTNELIVTVDNRRRRGACPQEQFNWMDYGGICRPVYLEQRPKVFIHDVQINPGRDRLGWFADVRVSLNRVTSEPALVSIESGRDTCAATLCGHDKIRIVRLRAAHPCVWSPGSGGTSTCTVTLGDDKLHVPFGFRTVALRKRMLEVNGVPVRLLGAAMHEYHPVFGNSLPPWQVDYDLALMKQAGLNAIRTAHYPHAQTFYDACDRAGIMVIAELPCWQYNEYHFARPHIRAFCSDMAHTMTAQLGNHPSIVGWMIQTESKTLDPGAGTFFKAINTAFKQSDPGRVTITAESPDIPREHLEVVKDPVMVRKIKIPATSGYVDIFGINEYSGWYSGKCDQLFDVLDLFRRRMPSKPMIVTEFGAEGIPGERSLVMHPWSEDYQTELLVRKIRGLLQRNDMAGFFIWLFIDYECASIGIRGINAKGLVDEYRRPKLAFNAVRTLLRPTM